MGDSLHVSGSSKNSEVLNNVTTSKRSQQCLVVSTQKNLQKLLKPLVSLKRVRLGRGSTDPIVFFLLKVAALGMLQRLSKARCPYIWQGLQALQIICYPPFKWIQRWTPLKILVKGMQKLSRPLLFLSIATAISDQSDYFNETSDNMDESQAQPESPPTQSVSDMRISGDEILDSAVSENWLLRLKMELEMQGITLPERINDDELQQFCTAANGDFSCLLASIKRTIRWRETYSILSAQELEMWSHMVFWHGCDVKLHPCLIIRLGLACSSLSYHDRPRFAQAVVSQVEYGVLHLVNIQDPRITVLMDCEGVSTFRFPMQMMRSCSTILQDHFPNRLALMFVIRLPPVVRVIAQTLIQVLKPTTRQKLQVVGEMYHNILTEYLQSVPSFLGGKCTCTKCHVHFIDSTQHREDTSKSELSPHLVEELEDTHMTDLPLNGNCDQILRTVIVGILVLWIFIALIAGMYDPDTQF